MVEEITEEETVKERKCQVITNPVLNTYQVEIQAVSFPRGQPMYAILSHVMSFVKVISTNCFGCICCQFFQTEDFSFQTSWWSHCITCFNAHIYTYTLNPRFYLQFGKKKLCFHLLSCTVYNLSFLTVQSLGNLL